MPDSVPGSRATTVGLTLGSSVYRDLETAGDRDWHRIDLAAGIPFDADGAGRSPSAGSVANGSTIIGTTVTITQGWLDQDGTGPSSDSDSDETCIPIVRSEDRDLGAVRSGR